MIPKLMAALAASLLLAAPALADERSGTTHFDTRFGPATGSFTLDFDRANGTFSRRGTVTLQNGRSFTYAISGTCTRRDRSCDFSGTATGPHGGHWQADGEISRSPGGVDVTGELTGPGGRVISFGRPGDRWDFSRDGGAGDGGN